MSDSAPANDTAVVDGVIEIPAGVFDNSLNDTIELPSISDIIDTVTPENQIDAVPSENQINAVPSGNQIDAAPSGDQVDVVSSGNQADSAPSGNQVNVVPSGSPVDAVPSGNQADTGPSGDQAAILSGDQIDAGAPDVQIDTGSSGNQVDSVPTGNQKDVAVTNTEVVEGTELSSAHNIETIGSDLVTGNVVKDTDLLFSGPYVTLEEVNADKDKLYDSDLCRNPEIKSYENGLNDNCRAFWSCERGHSVPVCCEKFFSYRSGRCVEDSNCTTECPDPCQNIDIISYPNDLNCRSFYECHEKKSKSMCCAEGQSFMNGTCVDDDVCIMPCPVDAIQLERQEVTAVTIQPSPNPDCSLEAVGTGSFQSIGNTNKNHVMSCPGNLVFSVKKCTCDFPTADVLDTLPRECKPEVCVDFEQVMNPVKVENHNNVDISGGRGHFNGGSYLAIPMYSFNERFSKKMNIKMLFKSKPGMGQDRQVLISNCRTVISARGSRLSPSLAIIIDKSIGRHYVIFLGTTKNNGNASIAHTFQPNQWTSLELLFDGQRLTASTNTIDYDTGTSIERQFDTKELTGELKVGLESLKIGKCLDQDGFHGEMDNVCIGDCLNGKFSGSPPV
ncbi:uncharacterized protein LOC132547218 [Ylistrum balloti]|uniref:uncharacterized protein LOC132547218 n=1 Tax=Ylistrum balloti TaxID=509963 RepID=UPI002905CD0B|nr:uncharacterized protein LOC132547218 [Ylistrum balloti]